MTGALSLLALQAAEEELVTGDITWHEGVRSAAVFVAAIAAAALLRWILVRAVDRGDADRHIGRLLGRFLSILVVCFGAVYALGILGVRIGPLLGALGVGGIAIAFAAQDILQNLIAGILLQLRRPFRIGEQVGSGDYEGVVEDVNLRTVVLTTYDGLRVYLPNAEVLKNPIINYTRTPFSRTDLTVGLAYDTDLEQAQQVLLEACRAAEGVAEKPGASVWVNAFADSSIEFVVRYWHPADMASRWRVRSAVAMSVKRALDAAGMTIPFPQRTLWFGPGGTTLQIGDRSEGRDLAAGDGRTASPGERPVP
ncbi:small-conductance mechanosensitive channel [Kineococcus xinjiangensis]|uniref:Small-conductance mechanosensitive channel n=1 Tax=Kineococcus xinjiangensis TaxID=512762 RepID=A0A2S6IWE1_9ACTN|nr:mechanosensitive ion channel family protein [Kineococcus xinjiangensis]PPK98596.1 small-conductance mechanosensitive channel [Kineococcus xinjiangensis]